MSGMAFDPSQGNPRTPLSPVQLALKGLLLWQQRVLNDPKSIMIGFEDDPDGLSIALFDGPLWDAAHKALDGMIDWDAFFDRERECRGDKN